VLQHGQDAVQIVITPYGEDLHDLTSDLILSLGEVIGCDFSAWPNVQRWYDRIQALPNWQSGNAALYAWTSFTTGQDYVRV
jgi:glutathione S-transferase